MHEEHGCRNAKFLDLSGGFYLSMFLKCEHALDFFAQEI